MEHEHNSFFHVPSSHRRHGVVVEALREKLERLSIGRITLLREREQMTKAVEELDRKIATVEEEEVQLKSALREYGVDTGSSLEITHHPKHKQVFISSSWSDARNKAQLLTDNPSESGHLKAQVIANIKAILQTVGSMHVRELYEMLKFQKIELSSSQRLSQILSESSEFEADRAKGWSLKKKI